MRQTRRVLHWVLLLNTAMLGCSLLSEFIVPALAYSVDRARGSRLTVARRKLVPYVDIKVKHLTEQDLAHGEKQVSAMLHDRPRMARYVRHGDEIWKWTVRQFGGEGLGSRIDWNATEPRALGDNTFPTRSHSDGNVRVRETERGGLPLHGEEQWAIIVFELHNIRNANALEDNWENACAGRLNKKEYIREITFLEFKTQLQQTAFFRSRWHPHAKAIKVSSTPQFWNVYAPEEFDKWRAQYADTDSYIRNYAKDFDEVVAYSKGHGGYQSDKAGKNADFDSVLRAVNKGVVEVAIKTLEGTGQALCSSGKFKDALPFYEQAAEVSAEDLGSAHPDHALAVNNLAIINHELKQFDEAERLYKQALNIREKVFGTDDPLVRELLKNLLALYRAQNKTYEAAAVGRRISAIDEEEYDYDVGNTDAIKSGF